MLVNRQFTERHHEQPNNVSRPDSPTPHNIFSCTLVVSDCAVCSDGYGRGVGNACHSCVNAKSQRVIWAGVIASVVVFLPLTTLAVVFLVGGLDAVVPVLKSVRRNMSLTTNASKVWSTSKHTLHELDHPTRRSQESYSIDVIAPVSEVTLESQHGTGECDIGHRGRESPPPNSGPDDNERTYARPSSPIVRAGVMFTPSDVPPRHASDEETPSDPLARLGTNDGKKSKCCGLGVEIKTWASKLPMYKLKILVVVWQILTVFSSITEVEFPESYSRFLAWIDVVNLDMGHMFAASCVLPSVNFYTSLLVTTLTPLALVAILLLTYHVAKHRAGAGAAGVSAQRDAWSRHVGAGLLLTYLVSVDEVVQVSALGRFERH